MKEAGLQTILSWDSDKPVSEVKHAQCCHCGGVFPFGPGHTKHRGWCFNCNGPICGAKCLDCVPLERQIEEMEGSKRRDQVSVGGSLWLP